MKMKEGKESNVSMERNHFREVVNTFSGSGILHEEGEWGGVGFGRVIFMRKEEISKGLLARKAHFGNLQPAPLSYVCIARTVNHDDDPISQRIIILCCDQRPAGL